MTEYMPYLPPEEGSWKRRFEITIPLLLLILVLVVVSWKLGWLAGIPIIGDWFKSPVSNVLIVGEDNSLALQFDSMATIMPVNYYQLKAEDINTWIDPAALNDYNLVIVTENAGSDPTYLSAVFRQNLDSYMAGGGKLILYGVAGSRDSDDPSLNEWNKDYVPVTCKSGLCTEADSKMADVPLSRLTFIISQTEHPMFTEFGTTITFPDSVSTLDYTMVNPKAGATTLVMVEDTFGETTVSYPAVVEMSYGMSGRVLYFSYHPAQQPSVFENAIKYLIGG